MSITLYSVLVFCFLAVTCAQKPKSPSNSNSCPPADCYSVSAPQTTGPGTGCCLDSCTTNICYDITGCKGISHLIFNSDGVAPPNPEAGWVVESFGVDPSTGLTGYKIEPPTDDIESVKLCFTFNGVVGQTTTASLVVKSGHCDSPATYPTVSLTGWPKTLAQCEQKTCYIRKEL
jgi:hypothetical protein